MKFPQVAILLFLFNIGYSQESNTAAKDSIVYAPFTCEEGTKQAQTDFNNGNYNCYSYGLMIQIGSPELDDFINKYRKTKYGIVTENRGCVITDYTTCYSQLMEELVAKKFGKNIYKKSRKEAVKLYNKTHKNQK